MAFTIEHRPDGLIEKRAEDNNHAQISALSNFLNKNLIGKEFSKQEELQTILDQWPAYAEEHGLEIDPDYGQWTSINIKDNLLEIETMGLGGPLSLAVINEVAEATEAQG